MKHTSQAFTENDREAVISCIAFIKQFKKPHFFSMALTFGAAVVLLGLVFSSSSLNLYRLCCLSVIVLSGILEMVYAIRVEFDITLLNWFLGQTSSIDNGLGETEQRPTDETCPKKSDSPLNACLNGCIRLFTTHAHICSIQVVIILCAVIADCLLNK